MKMNNDTSDLIFKWYSRAQLDYFDQYINLFIAYNAWFRKVTKKTNDREAITSLKSRVGIWDEYVKDEAMSQLKSLMTTIAKITNLKPLENLTRPTDPHWNGIVEDGNDWKGLIEFWYRIRCNLFHGAKSPEETREAKLVELAYKSLNEFMTEIINRMRHNFSLEDLSRMYELSLIEHPDKSEVTGFAKEAHELQWQSAQSEIKILNDKFGNAKNLWEVDL